MKNQPFPNQKNLLEDLLIHDNRLGIAIHENGETMNNFVTYNPYAMKQLFMHGREIVKPSARFDDKSVIEAPNSTLRDHSTPFTEEAYEKVGYYFSPESLEERKASMVGEIIPNDLIEKKLVEKLAHDYPKLNLQAKYDDLIAQKTTKREKALANPEEAIAKRVNHFSKMYTGEGLTEEEASSLQAALPLVEMFLANDLDAYQAETGHRPNLPNTLKEFEAQTDEWSKFLKFKLFRDSQEPIVVMGELKDHVTNILTAEYGMSWHSVGEVYANSLDEILKNIYDEVLLATGEPEGQSNEPVEPLLRKHLRKWLDGTSEEFINKTLDGMEKYQYDTEQMENFMVGMTAVAQKEVVKENHQWNTDNLIELGKEIRTHKKLIHITRQLGNPHHGRLYEAERDSAAEIAEAVPKHILGSAIKDGIKIKANIGDPTKGRGQIDAPQDAMRSGGYTTSFYGHPFIDLVPDIHSDINIAEVEKDRKPIKELARHEFRHYWTITHNLSNNPNMESAIENDVTHYAKLKQALQNGDTNTKEALAALLPPNTSESLEDIMKKVENTSSVWTNPEVWVKEKADKRSVGYSTISEVTEEVFPRIDEVVMEYGEGFAKALFPDTANLMLSLDKELTKNNIGVQTASKAWGHGAS